MKIESKYTKSFVSNSLTGEKYNQLYDFAMLINQHKNIISNEINSDLLFYLDFYFFDFLKLMREKYKGVIPSNFDKQLYEDVFKSYQNKFKSLENKIKFEKIEVTGVEYYKRDTKKNKKGDFKKYKIKKESTKLTICLTYLSRYGSENTIDYINSQLKKDNLSSDKIKFYENILFYIGKFGFNRLFSLANSKKNRILNKYKKPIEFKSLNFRGRSRLFDIISYNKNYNSKINSFISLSWLSRGEKLDIPVKYSKDYHGNIKNYHKKTPDYEYVVVFTDDKKIKINLCVDGFRGIAENKTNFVGVDVNIKNNLFALSNGKTFDYNRKLLNDLTSELRRIDKLKENKKYVVGKKKQKKLNSIRNKMQKSNESICVDVCKHLNEENIDHVVFENLNNSFGKSYVKKDDVNFNRIVSALRISSLKNMFERISRKYDIAFSTVHPEYTSKTCSICGCIDDENRLSQEEFKCVDCGYENNADLNAATNIKQRVSVTVLRDKLLKQTKIGNNTFEPKALKKEKVKELLLSFRQNPDMGREV